MRAIPREHDPGTVRRILLVQVRNMGDVLLCTPSIRAVRAAFPHARIDFLSAAPGADALAGNPYVDECLVWRSGWRDGWKLLRAIRGRRYDLVVDFQSTPRTARYVRFSGARRRLGVRGRGPRNSAYTELVPKVSGPVYTAVQKLMVLAPLGIEVPNDLSLDLVVGEAERRWAAEVWARFGLEGESVAAVSPVSREDYKQWGAERWAAVADDLAAAGARILVTGGPGERDQVRAVVERMRHPAVWDYGPTTLRQLGALYERCALWVGNDGGPKHVAAAVGTPTVMVVRWQIGPVWADATARVPQRFVDAEPAEGCDLHCERCAHLGCLTALQPHSVSEPALQHLRFAEPRDAHRGGARAER
jgi:heptosyltransferase III